ncbi:MAG: ABC transporter substrate-binding protein [Campylobacterales bacterium]
MRLSALWPKGLLLVLFTGLSLGALWRLYSVPLHQGSEIVLGQSCALSGPSAELGRGMRVGANAWFAHVNALGGIQGRTVKLITLDDRYEPRLSEANTRKLIEEYGVFALFGYVGTPTSQAVLPLVEQHKIPFVAPLTGATLLREPPHPYVVNLRPGYEAEIDLLARYLRSLGLTRVAVFYQNDSYGKTGLFAARSVFERHRIQLVAEGAYTRNTLSVGHALYEIAPHEPQAVIMIDAYKPGAEFIRQARKRGLENALFAHVSFVNSDSLAAELGEAGMRNVLVAQVVPPAWEMNTPRVNEYREIMARYYPDEPLSFASLEGFLTAQSVTEGLENSIDRLTREGFLEALRAIQKKRRSELGVWITRYENGRMRPVEGWGP